MELRLFNKKFAAFKLFEKRLPGIALGLNVLSHLNNSINFKPIKSSEDKNFLNYYDYETKNIKKLYLMDLNLKLYEVYMYVVYLNRKLTTNTLYFELLKAYDKTYCRYNYLYFGAYTKYNLISKFIHGLRKNFYNNSLNQKNDFYSFDLNEIINSFDQFYFGGKISYDQFYLFWFDFVWELKELNIIEYNDQFFKFKSEYQEELINIIFFSFDLMILGNNKVYDVYDLTKDDVETNLNRIYEKYLIGTIEYKFHINDLLVSLVISSCVSEICAPKHINNIFFETSKIK